MTKPKSGPQDMPPTNGYDPIQTKRVHLRRILNPWLTCGLTIAATVYGCIGFNFNYRKMRKEEVELRSARNAITPFLMAERDRTMLKQTIKNRDEEKELMQDFPGWEVGTYFGDPIFYYSKPEQFIEQSYEEYIAHAHPAETLEKFVRFHLL